ncbi:retrovirus-related pol polyprotein from transposon TNT 1-94 [Tanacetum coccineum]
MLLVLISGYPRNDIDVFLEPLVDDLHTLFETGVDTYDVSTKDNFNLRVVVLWTINDYPALGTLCGCSYSGFKGCVVCGKDATCVRLSASSKQSYVGHRRYLPYNHPFIKQKKAFNGQQEFLPALIPMTGEQIYNEVQHIENKHWRHNSVPHCIDFMHVEKNVAKSLVETLLHVPRKTKDGVNARLDLAELGVKPELFAIQEEDKTTLPPAGYTLTNAEKDTFCETLHNIRVPQGYCSNFTSLVNLKDRKLMGLKSHDYHMLMQEFLPIAIRSIMHLPTRYAIIRFCFFFKSICSKEIILQELDKMQAELVVTLCLLEKFFPPSFFDIMIHLTVHLTREVKLCGPICFQWMYPFKRCMKVIKGHVRNRNKPEGCIAEETIAEETIEFFSEYHKSMETIGIPPDKHETYENEEGKPLSAGKSSEVSAELFQKAHLYVIQNTDEIVPYIESSDEENTQANDMFSKADGFHAVPPPITGNFLTSRANISFAEEEEEVVPKGQQQAASAMDTTMGEPLRLGYGAMRRRELAVEEDRVPCTFEVGQSSTSMPEQQGAERVSAFRHLTLTTWVDSEDGRDYTDIPAYVSLVAPLQTLPSPEWSSGSLPISPSSPVALLPIASPVATLTATITVDEDQFLEVGAQLELHGSILHDHTLRLDVLPPTLFADIDRDVRELYTRSGVVKDEIFSQRENHDLRMQLTEERRERL